jgi:putative SOS response-associated peptidase YedK
MCGRAAQSLRAVGLARDSLASNSKCRVVDNVGPRVTSDSTETSPRETQDFQVENDQGSSFPWRDNFNLSPGHDAVVFTLGQNGAIEMDRKIWGLVPKGGMPGAPLPLGPSKHFANLMFNARSDTLFSKPTFSRLLNEGKTCVVAFDGFFEWKTDPVGGGKGKKQPYFVFRNKEGSDHDNSPRDYLLLAGLWTSVSTGYSEPSNLDTFTLLTTEVCEPLSWLHSRMPVCIWDENLAMEWLRKPTQRLLQQLDTGARQSHKSLLQWHAVTTQMSSTKFRSPDAIKALPKPKTVKSFFAAAASKTESPSKERKNSSTKPAVSVKTLASSNSLLGQKESSKTTPLSSFLVKRPAPASSTEKQTSNSGSNKDSTLNKKTKRGSNATTPVKKGSITSFFSPK